MSTPLKAAFSTNLIVLNPVLYPPASNVPGYTCSAWSYFGENATFYDGLFEQHMS